MNELSEIYHWYSINDNEDKFAKIYTKAAELDNLDAIKYLAFAYDQGYAKTLTKRQQKEKSLYLYRRAVEQYGSFGRQRRY